MGMCTISDMGMCTVIWYDMGMYTNSTLGTIIII